MPYTVDMINQLAPHFGDTLRQALDEHVHGPYEIKVDHAVRRVSVTILPGTNYSRSGRPKWIMPGGRTNRGFREPMPDGGYQINYDYAQPGQGGATVGSSPHGSHAPHTSLGESQFVLHLVDNSRHREYGYELVTKMAQLPDSAIRAVEFGIKQGRQFQPTGQKYAGAGAAIRITVRGDQAANVIRNLERSNITIRWMRDHEAISERRAYGSAGAFGRGGVVDAALAVSGTTPQERLYSALGRSVPPPRPGTTGNYFWMPRDDVTPVANWRDPHRVSFGQGQFGSPGYNPNTINALKPKVYGTTHGNGGGTVGQGDDQDSWTFAIIGGIFLVVVVVLAWRFMSGRPETAGGETPEDEKRALAEEHELEARGEMVSPQQLAMIATIGEEVLP